MNPASGDTPTTPELGWFLHVDAPSTKKPLWLGCLPMAIVFYAFCWNSLVAPDNLPELITTSGFLVSMTGLAMLSLNLSGLIDHLPVGSIPTRTGVRVTAPVWFVWVLSALALLSGIAVAAAAEGFAPGGSPGLRFAMFTSAVLVGLVSVAGFGLRLWRRGFVLSPEGIRVTQSWATHTIPWSSIGEVIPKDDASGSTTQPTRLSVGVQLAITGPVDAGGTTRMREADAGPFPVFCGGLSADPETLINAIVSLHAHPELRELLTTRNRWLLLRGPGSRKSREMYLGQEWHPWGARIRAALEHRELG